jgi:hypothetical protein
MKKFKHTIHINAPKEKVWKSLWNDNSYRQWTSVFSEGSHVLSDWKEGSKALFLSGTGDGMYSMIAKNIPNELMSFKHLGVVKEGSEQPLDEETKKWSGAMENYTLKDNENETDLTVEMDITDEFEDYFKTTFPKALERVKELAETESSL